jgi:hypothetical protein
MVFVHEQDFPGVHTMMRMARTVLAGFFAIGLSAVAVPPPTQAADGYGGVTVEVTISDVTQIGGRDISVRAVARTAAGNPVICTNFTVTFGGDSAEYVNGQGFSTSGSSFDHVYDTDRVPRDLPGFAVAHCTYEDTTLPQALGGTSRLSVALPAALQTASSARGAVNLLAFDDDDDDSDDSDDSDDDDDDGGLPDTGGERLLWLLIGLALVAGGTTVIVSSRDRDAAA